MLFNVSLICSLIIFISGLAYKIYHWKNGSAEAGSIRMEHRADAVAPETATWLAAIKTFAMDILLQRQLLDKQGGFYVWIMHLLIFYGFILLLLMHALGGLVTNNLFSDYYPTRNPFFFLRDLFGAMLLIGLLMAVLRRFFFKSTLPPEGNTDYFGLVCLLVIILSGFALEGLKISSPTFFRNMVDDYSRIDDEEGINALEAYWNKHQGLSSVKDFSGLSRETMTLGADLHRENCADCHADAQWAFGGYAVSRAIKPAAPKLDQINLAGLLNYIHFLACFIGLAYLPFSRMFHVIAAPVCILVQVVRGPRPADLLQQTRPSNLELDACSHGGACHEACPVNQGRSKILQDRKRYKPFFEYLANNFKLNSGINPESGKREAEKR